MAGEQTLRFEQMGGRDLMEVWQDLTSILQGYVEKGRGGVGEVMQGLEELFRAARGKADVTGTFEQMGVSKSQARLWDRLLRLRPNDAGNEMWVREKVLDGSEGAMERRVIDEALDSVRFMGGEETGGAGVEQPVSRPEMPVSADLGEAEPGDGGDDKKRREKQREALEKLAKARQRPEDKERRKMEWRSLGWPTVSLVALGLATAYCVAPRESFIKRAVGLIPKVMVWGVEGGEDVLVPEEWRVHEVERMAGEGKLRLVAGEEQKPVLLRSFETSRKAIVNVLTGQMLDNDLEDQLEGYDMVKSDSERAEAKVLGWDQGIQDIMSPTGEVNDDKIRTPDELQAIRLKLLRSLEQAGYRGPEIEGQVDEFIDLLEQVNGFSSTSVRDKGVGTLGLPIQSNLVQGYGQSLQSSARQFQQRMMQRG